jgi:hypothetical protein
MSRATGARAGGRRSSPPVGRTTGTGRGGSFPPHGPGGPEPGAAGVRESIVRRMRTSATSTPAGEEHITAELRSILHNELKPLRQKGGGAIRDLHHPTAPLLKWNGRGRLGQGRAPAARRKRKGLGRCWKRMRMTRR